MPYFFTHCTWFTIPDKLRGKFKNMKTEELKLIIKEGEGLTVEFKERYSSKISHDIVAFSNTKGIFKSHKPAMLRIVV